jgi:hypothetical protein
MDHKTRRHLVTMPAGRGLGIAVKLSLGLT